MKKFFVIYIMLLMLFFFLKPVFAKIPVPGRTNSWVNDYAGIIDKETKGRLESLISSIKQKTPDRVEIIIATFTSLEGWGFDEFVYLYGEKWRENKKGRRDNGVVIVVALKERRVAVGVGQNLKGILTNEKVRNIIENVITPEFSKTGYSEGIKKGTEIIANALNESEITAGYPIIGITKILLILFVIFILFLAIKHVVKHSKS